MSPTLPILYPFIRCLSQSSRNTSLGYLDVLEASTRQNLEKRPIYICEITIISNCKKSYQMNPITNSYSKVHYISQRQLFKLNFLIYYITFNYLLREWDYRTIGLYNFFTSKRIVSLFYITCLTYNPIIHSRTSVNNQMLYNSEIRINFIKKRQVIQFRQ